MGARLYWVLGRGECGLQDRVGVRRCPHECDFATRFRVGLFIHHPWGHRTALLAHVTSLAQLPCSRVAPTFDCLASWTWLPLLTITLAAALCFKTNREVR